MRRIRVDGVGPVWFEVDAVKSAVQSLPFISVMPSQGLHAKKYLSLLPMANGSRPNQQAAAHTQSVEQMPKPVLAIAQPHQRRSQCQGRAKREGVFGFEAAQSHGQVQGARDKQQGQQRPWAQPGAQSGHQFEVTLAHALDTLHPLEHPGHEPKQAVAPGSPPNCEL